MADRIPSQYESIVKKSLIAAAGVAPLGLHGGIDAVGVGAIWATMFLAIRNKAGSSLGVDPKRICVAVASMAALHCNNKKAAIATFLLVPKFTHISSDVINKIPNMFLTYNFAATLIELFEKPIYNDDDIITFFVNHLKKLPNTTEVKEFIKIYQS